MKLGEITVFYAVFQANKEIHTEAVARRCSVKNDILKNFAEFIGKHLCQSLFFNKVAGMKHRL